MFGPPGAGKGTQANFIVKKFKLTKISTGDILREEIKKKTLLGNKIKSIINSGSLASDEIVQKLIENIIFKQQSKKGFIFDGYPRNLSQAKSLDTLMKKNSDKIQCVLSLDVDRETIVKRILGRQNCLNCGLIFNKYFNPSNKNNHKCDEKYLDSRSDDNEETINNRFKIYKDETLPILSFYKQQNLLHEIKGTSKIDDISQEIRDIIASIET